MSGDVQSFCRNASFFLAEAVSPIVAVTWVGGPRADRYWIRGRIRLSTYTNGRKPPLMGNVEATNRYWYPDDLVVESATSDLSEDDGLILALEINKIRDRLLNGTSGERTIRFLAGEDSAAVGEWCARNGLILG